MFNVVIGSIVLALSQQEVFSHCIDIHSQVVSEGLHYVPGPNTCTLCICDEGSPKWCKSVLCSPPQNCKSFQIGNSCCEFKCLDDILTNDGYKDTYDLALRLIASAFTALLSLSILFLLYHRLRRRKIRLRQTRPSSDDQRSLNSIGYITGGLGYHPASYGYLGSGSNDLEYPYEPSTQFSLWKPPGNYFPRGEAPPPYEEAVRLSQLEHDASSSVIVTSATQSNSNNLTYAISTHHPTTNQLQYQNSCCVLLTRTEESLNKAQATAAAASSSSSSSKDKHARDEHYHTTKKYSKSSTSDGNKQKSKSFENICERERGGNQASMPTSSEVKNHIYANQNIDPITHKQNFEKDSQRIATNSTLGRKYGSRHRTISKTFQSKCKGPTVGNIEPSSIKEMKRPISASNHRTLPASFSLACTPEYFLPDKSFRELTIHKDNIPRDISLYKNQLSGVSSSREHTIEKLNREASMKFDYKKESDINCKTLTKSSNWSTIYIPSSSKTPILDKICQLKETLPTIEPKEMLKTHNIDHRDSTFQLASQDDDEDYRSECENCKFAGITDGEEEIPETMTLQRRPLELEEEMSYYRTSSTLPTNSKRPSRVLSAKPGRESWFLTMDEYSSSDDSA